ncbi:MAG: RagB/SusD family nutrient uptake outer membrane protein [Bacteroidales bacterium]|nr:RagB/SusD family nutrient uptake outer membrane protein [Bacteroidales bacterium]
MKINTFIRISLAALALSCSSCNYLDVIPDNVATEDMIYSMRENAEKQLYTLYYYIPEACNVFTNPGLAAGYEFWNCAEKNYYYSNSNSWNMQHGEQSTDNPYFNYWSGGNGGYNLFTGIRECNSFIENVGTVQDLSKMECERWIAEAKTIKAYLHYYLLTLYGPIPFIDENLPVSSDAETMCKVVREPVDQVVNKIVDLLDETIAAPAFPDNIRVRDSELGRLTKTAAMAIKAKVLLWAASPLFNGNPDFPNFKNAEGVELINSKYDQTKWERAAQATLDAIQLAEQSEYRLYTFDSYLPYEVSEDRMRELTLRSLVTYRFNEELIWGLGDKDGSSCTSQTIQGICNAPLTAYQQGSEIPWSKNMHNPTMDIAEQYYSNHGLPIDEDKTYDYAGRFNVVDRPEGHDSYIGKGERTAYLNCYREPRFYANLGFDRGQWFNLEATSDDAALVVKSRKGETAGMAMNNYNITGYSAKKLVNYTLVMTQSSNTKSGITYPFPIIRLADLYLMYAEARNESLASPDETVFEYLQKVRDRAGLDRETGSVKETWKRFAKNPSKVDSQEGMREIIRRERLIEFAMEGQRWYDVRRWRAGEEYFTRPVRGWNVSAPDETGYYNETYIYFPKFNKRDYFIPIKLTDTYVNKKLIQNPGWE